MARSAIVNERAAPFGPVASSWNTSATLLTSSPGARFIDIATGHRSTPEAPSTSRGPSGQGSETPSAQRASHKEFEHVRRVLMERLARRHAAASAFSMS